MTKRQTQRGLHYRALAEGYRALKPQVAASYKLAADHYDHNDPPLETVARASVEGEREGKATAA